METTKMKRVTSILSSFLLAGLLTVGAVAQTTNATRFDASVQTSVSKKLAEKTKFAQVKTDVEDGIVTLTGNVNLYQDKLDAAKEARKLKNVQGVRNLIEVAGPAVTDAQLTEDLSKKLYYDRVGLV
jgi:osmotically-inducible protein OsmY